MGINVGKKVAIPRIKLAPSESTIPFKFSRMQFPIQLAFAMTINKAQGQSLGRVGIYLPNPVFSHGQLYVALSRASSRSNLTLLIQSATDRRKLLRETKNVVFRGVL
jgi:ATP-dependent exoDNAse (exonuclease V) alpha subunit